MGVGQVGGVGAVGRCCDEGDGVGDVGAGGADLVVALGVGLYVGLTADAAGAQGVSGPSLAEAKQAT